MRIRFETDSKADVEYGLDLQSVTGTIQGALLFDDPSLVITDAGAASGNVTFSEAGRVLNGVPYSDPSSGFVSFGGILNNPDTNAYTTPDTTINLTLNSQDQITSGTIDVNTSSIEYMLTLANGYFSGVYGTDGPSGCVDSPCSVSGTYSGPYFTTQQSGSVAVPEPSSLAAMLVGLLGCGMVVPRRRRRI